MGTLARRILGDEAMDNLAQVPHNSNLMRITKMESTIIGRCSEGMKELEK
jgi:hypothetical protein